MSSLGIWNNREAPTLDGRTRPVSIWRCPKRLAHGARKTVAQALYATPLWRPAKSIVHTILRLGVPRVVPRLVNCLPHDTAASTQGLVYRDGILYESTGGMQTSSLRSISADDGRLLSALPIPNDFAEGIAILGSRLYQLSWKSGITRVYDLPDLKRACELRYQGDGWGLATYGDQLIKSNGSSVLTFHDNSFAIQRTLTAHSHGVPIRGLNDLACVNERLYGNVYGASDVFEVCLRTGRLLRVIDCRQLYKAAAPHNNASVMNGITYREDTRSFLVTGKNWKYLFEITVPPAE